MKVCCVWLVVCLLDVCNLFSINRFLDILPADEVDVAGQVLVSFYSRVWTVLRSLQANFNLSQFERLTHCPTEWMAQCMASVNSRDNFTFISEKKGI